METRQVYWCNLAEGRVATQRPAELQPQPEPEPAPSGSSRRRTPRRRRTPAKTDVAVDHAQRLFAAWYDEPSPSRLH